MSEDTKLREVPQTIRRRRKAWFFYFQLFNALYYCLGVLAVLSGTIITLISSEHHLILTKILGASAALSSGLLIVIKPDIAAREYVRAWRVLDDACSRYQLLPDYSVEDLINAQHKGEKLMEKSSEKIWY